MNGLTNDCIKRIALNSASSSRHETTGSYSAKHLIVQRWTLSSFVPLPRFLSTSCASSLFGTEIIRDIMCICLNPTPLCSFQSTICPLCHIQYLPINRNIHLHVKRGSVLSLSLSLSLPNLMPGINTYYVQMRNIVKFWSKLFTHFQKALTWRLYTVLFSEVALLETDFHVTNITGTSTNT